MVGVIALVLVFRQSFENRSTLKTRSKTNTTLGFTNYSQFDLPIEPTLFRIARIITHQPLEPMRKPTKTKAIALLLSIVNYTPFQQELSANIEVLFGCSNLRRWGHWLGLCSQKQRLCGAIPWAQIWTCCQENNGDVTRSLLRSAFLDMSVSPSCMKGFVLKKTVVLRRWLIERRNPRTKRID